MRRNDLELKKLKFIIFLLIITASVVFIAPSGAYAGSSASYIISTEVFSAGAEGNMTSSSYELQGKARDHEYVVESSTLYKLGGGFFLAIFGDLIANPIITSVYPSSASYTLPVTVSIYGLNFEAGATTKLTRSGETDISGESVAFINAGQINCTFDIVGKATGTWDVVVVNPDSRTGTLTGGFEITLPEGVPEVVGTPLNYPNPFDPDTQPTTIRYELNKPAPIELSIFNIQGQRIWFRKYPANADGGKQGINEILWNGYNAFSEVVPNGIYVYRIASGGKTLATGKIAVYR